MPDKVVFKGTLEVMIRNEVNDWELGKIRKIQESNKLDGWLNESSIQYKKKFIDLTSDELIDEFILDRIRGENIIGGFKSKGCGKVNIATNKI
jgi:hypothetical protein